ncbi:MAG TPA: tetratricopeptide repeat protein [Methanoregulaceae archaeon]|nr:tetratricopeptide repeat protein [Methanoregulaceae archaeon]HPD75340.1 tetratricopeptide repeat protein [Methanoregulaceae archaeon]HRY75910.1 tetratricopeptide repeat protein [Methanoregulaceae archaeon]
MTPHSTQHSRVFLVILVVCLCIPAVCAAEESETFRTAGALYTKSVDLAEAKNYSGALAAADAALAYNESSLTAIIQAHRSGLLVTLERNDEAIAAADAAIAIPGNLTVAHSVAYFNKGNALLNLGRTAEARQAFDKAHELDTSLVSPLSPAPTKSPVSPGTVPAAAACGAALFLWQKKILV